MEGQQLHFSFPQSSNSGNNKSLKDNSLQNASGHDGSGHLADSGYNSYHSFNASCSVARSVLATIDEDNEADCSFEEICTSETPLKINNILTPTTAASLEQISNFHLTTPQGVINDVLQRRKALARRPTRQNLCLQLTPDKSSQRDQTNGTETPIRSGRKCENNILTPRKNKTSAKRKFPTSFREKLYSDGDQEQMRKFSEIGDSLEEDCKKLDDISPIVNAKRRKNSDIDSLIRSSTPKTASFKSNFHLESQENVNWDAMRQGKPLGTKLRRFQSFSPSKMYSYKRRDTILQDKSIMQNTRAPLRRQNALQENSPQKDRIPTTPSRKSLEASLDQHFEISAEFNITPVKATNFDALLDAPIVSQPEKTDDPKEPDLDKEISRVPYEDDCSLESSQSQKILSEDDSILRDVPVRILDKSLPSIPENESPFVISLKIPNTLTPPSKSCKLKRLSSRSLSSSKKDKRPSKSASPKLRQQSTIPGSHRRSYVGTERLNILKRLNENDKDALEIVLDYISDCDLVRVVAVSRGWRSIIESHRRTYRRLREYLAQEELIKENIDRSRESSLVVGKTPIALEAKEGTSVVHRQPFGMCNVNDINLSLLESRRADSAQKSPPISPSKRKFRENQKVASHLKKSERLKICPRCEKPSRVVQARAGTRNATGAANPRTAAMLDKSYTLPDPSTSAGTDLEGTLTSPVSPNKSERIRRNLFSTSLLSGSASGDRRTPVRRTSRRYGSVDSAGLSSSLLERKKNKNVTRRNGDESQCDYAVCSGQSCGFIFCVKCLCEYHPDAICKDLAPNSPSKEEETGKNVACSKQSRRSLQRLRK